MNSSYNFSSLVLVLALALSSSACTAILGGDSLSDSNSSREHSRMANERFEPSDTIRQAALISGERSTESIYSSKVPPVEVSVAQAFFDGDSLNVKVHLKTLKDMRTEDIVVGVSGLKEGVLVEEVFQRVSDVVVGSELQEDSLVALRFKLASQDLSEYQVRCSWGEEANVPVKRFDRASNEATANEQEILAQQELASSQEERVLGQEIDIKGLPKEEPDLPVRQPLARASLATPAERVNAERARRDDSVTEDSILVASSRDRGVIQKQRPSRNQNASSKDSGAASESEWDVSKNVVLNNPLGFSRPDGELVMRKLNVESQKTSCAKEPCDLLYTVIAKIVNESPDVITGVDLAVGFFWANSGALPVFPKESDKLTQNEQKIPLEGLVLTPGQMKTVRIKLDQSVPQVPGGSFIPHARLLK